MNEDESSQERGRATPQGPQRSSTTEHEELQEQELDQATTQRQPSNTHPETNDASTRSDEDEVTAQSKTQPERSIGNENLSRPTEDQTEALLGELRTKPSVSEDDGPMVQEGDSCEGSPTKPATMSTSTAPDMAEEARAIVVPPSWTAEAQRLYRLFCHDVATAQKEGAHCRSKTAIRASREADTGLRAEFEKCLALARQTTSAWIVEQWVSFIEVGREKRKRHEASVQRAGASSPLDSSTNIQGIPAIVATARRYFEEAREASYGKWQAAFQYRRAAVNLARTCDEYAKLQTKEKTGATDILSQDALMYQKALFREIDQEHGCPKMTTTQQTRWRRFQNQVSDGRRWDILCQELGGFGALLLIDTRGYKFYIERAALPIFSAWVKLIPRVKLTIEEIAERMEGYYDGLADVNCYSRHLPPLKLENPPSREASPSTRFERRRGPDRPSSTIDPRYLATNPLSDPVNPPSVVLTAAEYDPFPVLFDVLPDGQDSCKHNSDEEARGFDAIGTDQSNDALFDPGWTDEEMARELEAVL